MDGHAQKNESQEQVLAEQLKEVQLQDENTACVLLPVKKPEFKYSVGDIVWAKIIGSPLWPSIVCYDPTNKQYIKDPEENQKLALHVRFCNYYGQRSWATVIEPYTTKDDLIAKYPKFLIRLKKYTKEKGLWDGAVSEADHMLLLNKKERILYFCKTHDLDCCQEFGINDSTETDTPEQNSQPAPESGGACWGGTNPIVVPKCDGLLNLDQQKQLIIDTYGISIIKKEVPEKGLDLNNLVPTQTNYRVPRALLLRINEMEHSSAATATKKNKK